MHIDCEGKKKKRKREIARNRLERQLKVSSSPFFLALVLKTEKMRLIQGNIFWNAGKDTSSGAVLINCLSGSVAFSFLPAPREEWGE